MNFDPEKVFIGLINLFSILLLGVLLTWLLTDEVNPVALGVAMPSSMERKPGPPSCSRANFSATWSCGAGRVNRTLSETYHPINTTLKMVAIRRGDILPESRNKPLWY